MNIWTIYQNVVYKELKNKPYQISQIVNHIWYTHHNRIKIETKNTTRKSTNVGTQMYLKIAMAKKNVVAIILLDER